MLMDMKVSITCTRQSSIIYTLLKFLKCNFSVYCFDTKKIFRSHCEIFCMNSFVCVIISMQERKMFSVTTVRFMLDLNSKWIM